MSIVWLFAHLETQTLNEKKGIFIPKINGFVMENAT